MRIIGPRSEDVERLMKRCQTGVGGKRALDDAHDIMAACYGTLGALLVARNALAVWSMADCACPCCGDMSACATDCTFAHDDPAANARMQAARDVLFARGP